MARYIDAERILSYIERLLNIGTGKKKSLEYLKKFIEHHSTADVVEVVHGEWKVYGYSGYKQCSECKREYSLTTSVFIGNYCPNCGTKMDGKKVE